MTKILGLDLGTNSIGWALVDDEAKQIVKAGSRIIPMDEGTLGDYEKGNLKSAAAERTSFRSIRKIKERVKLRRERLLRVLNVLDFLPKSFQEHIDFEVHPGKFKEGTEPLIAYCKNAEGKSEFIYQEAFEEMLRDFEQHQPDLVEGGKKVPYDWTLFYLRQKALKQPISKEELAWIILNFNTKRGYYQLRGKDEITEAEDKKEEYAVLTVQQVELISSNAKGKGKYAVTYTNGSVKELDGFEAPCKVGDEMELIITTQLDKDGNIKKDKDGKEKITSRMPKEDDWTLVKKRTEFNLKESGLTVGAYIYQYLLAKPDVKVRGKLIHTIDRVYYKEELRQILEKQREFISELRDSALYEQCVKELYRQNENHRNSLSNKDVIDFLLDDILFYQRPLKTKKGTIADCQYEKYYYRNKETNELLCVPVKCIPKSNPLFQEFRLRQFISNVKIKAKMLEENGKWQSDVDVTGRFLKSADDYCKLFDWLNDKKTITQKQFLAYKGFGLGKKAAEYEWNYGEDAELPCNCTRYEINARLKKVGVQSSALLQKDFEHLWHILYSVDDPIEIKKSLTSFIEGIKSYCTVDEETFISVFSKYVPFEEGYGSYSEKAIRKLLPLMRMGKDWNADGIDMKTKERINKLIDGEVDETISDDVREKFSSFSSIEQFQGLPLFLACYAVYGRHSEAGDTSKWTTPEDIDDFLLHKFKQHSLRNPIVEMIIAETLRVVRDIWRVYGKIDEIHVELGRSLKQNAEKRRKDAENNQKNNRTNLRIRALLQEFAADSTVENVRPYSPIQQEKLKIYESAVLEAYGDNLPEEIKSIVKGLSDTRVKVSHSDVVKYKLWLEQKYKSPYTGIMIPISKLFTDAYQIEHVIPQKRYFDDSLNNKVICEAEVNKEKGAMLAYEFISKMGGKTIQGAFGKTFKLLDKKQYEDFVLEHYSTNRTKKRNLLAEDIPAEFTRRQMNDTRYISRTIISLLSKIVRDEEEQSVNSKHIIVTTGGVTDRLKREWGMGDVWNMIIYPRFERLNEKIRTTAFGTWKDKDGKRYFQTEIPLECSADGVTKKRIDHRHHALDAIIIACTTRNHVNYLNNESSVVNQEDIRQDLKHRLCTKTKTIGSNGYIWAFNKPWDTFTQDVFKELDGIIVSFKQNLRVITKSTNFYERYVNGKKVMTKQTKGDGWAIRKSLHKAGMAGKVSLQGIKEVKFEHALEDWRMIVDKSLRREIKKLIAQYEKFDYDVILSHFKAHKFIVNGKDYKKVSIYYYKEKGKDAMVASRTAINTEFNKKKIETVTDSGIRKILLNHLERSQNDSQIAFSPQGIEEMNRNIKELNGGKEHKPIYKARTSGTLGLKFSVGDKNCKNKQFVVTDDGTNLFCAIYVDEKGERSYQTIPFRVAIERLKNREEIADLYTVDERKLLFCLSPNDLVYLPLDVDSEENIKSQDVYRMMKTNDGRCFFVPNTFALPILSKKELNRDNRIEVIEYKKNKISIKSICIKIIVDRLGRVVKVYK